MEGSPSRAIPEMELGISSPPIQDNGRPPPSPLTGGYLLVVIGLPHNPSHKEVILQKLAKGFLSWNFDNSNIDIEEELSILTAQAVDGEYAQNGERLIQFASEHLVTEILIHPQVNTMRQCVRNLLSSFTKYRYIIHAGYTFAGSGSWMLQDGSFSVSDFVEAFYEPEAQRVVRAYENTIQTDVRCAPEGGWNNSRLNQENFTKFCRVDINPVDRMSPGSDVVNRFTNYLKDFMPALPVREILEPSEVVGNIRFGRPTLYIFPGGDGDAALFGINGFNMLVDGGFDRRACFWNFVRHLDRLDAVLFSTVNNINIGGISTLIERKALSHVYPQIGHFFGNIHKKKFGTSDGDKDSDALLINLIEESNKMISNLKHLQLRPHPCYRETNVEPINLYHKVGHGTLDMYIISPARDSREVKEFLSKWNNNDVKLFAGYNSGRASGKEIKVPLQNLISICALLIWQPADPKTNITRILFPGNAPQNKVFEGLEKIKHLECLKKPTCNAQMISPLQTALAVRQQACIRQNIIAEDENVSTASKDSDEQIKPKSTPSPKILSDKIIPKKEFKAKTETSKDLAGKTNALKKEEKHKTELKTVKQTDVKSQSTKIDVTSKNKTELDTNAVLEKKVIRPRKMMKQPLAPANEEIITEAATQPQNLSENKQTASTKLDDIMMVDKVQREIIPDEKHDIEKQISSADSAVIEDEFKINKHSLEESAKKLDINESLSSDAIVKVATEMVEKLEYDKINGKIETELGEKLEKDSAEKEKPLNIEIENNKDQPNIMSKLETQEHEKTKVKSIEKLTEEKIDEKLTFKERKIDTQTQEKMSTEKPEKREKKEISGEHNIDGTFMFDDKKKTQDLKEIKGKVEKVKTTTSATAEKTKYRENVKMIKPKIETIKKRLESKEVTTQKSLEKKPQQISSKKLTEVNVKKEPIVKKIDTKHGKPLPASREMKTNKQLELNKEMVTVKPKLKKELPVISKPEESIGETVVVHKDEAEKKTVPSKQKDVKKELIKEEEIRKEIVKQESKQQHITKKAVKPSSAVGTTIKAKVPSRIVASKSIKDENNRKVAESRKLAKATGTSQSVPITISKKPKPTPGKSLVQKIEQPPSQQPKPVKRPVTKQKDVKTEEKLDSSALPVPSVLELVKQEKKTEPSVISREKVCVPTYISSLISTEGEDDILIVETTELTPKKLSTESEGNLDKYSRDEKESEKDKINREKQDTNMISEKIEEEVIQEVQEYHDLLMKNLTHYDKQQLIGEVDSILTTAKEIVTKKTLEEKITDQSEDLIAKNLSIMKQEEKEDEKKMEILLEGKTSDITSRRTVPALSENEKLDKKSREPIVQDYVEATKPSQLAWKTLTVEDSLPKTEVKKEYILKDAVKTPDEVADLPVHEEVDNITADMRKPLPLSFVTGIIEEEEIKLSAKIEHPEYVTLSPFSSPDEKPLKVIKGDKDSSPELVDKERTQGVESELKIIPQEILIKEETSVNDIEKLDISKDKTLQLKQMDLIKDERIGRTELEEVEEKHSMKTEKEEDTNEILHVETQSLERPEILKPDGDKEILEKVLVTKTDGTDQHILKEKDEIKVSITTKDEKIEPIKENKDEYLKKTELPSEIQELRKTEVCEEIHEEDQETSEEVSIIESDKTRKQDILEKKHDIKQLITTKDITIQSIEEMKEEYKKEKKEEKTLVVEEEPIEKSGKDKEMETNNEQEKFEIISITDTAECNDGKKEPSDQQRDYESRMSSTTQDQEFAVIKEEKAKKEKEKQDQQILRTEKEMHKESKQQQVMFPDEDAEKLKEIQITEVYKKDKDKTSITTDKVTKQGELEKRDQQVLHTEKEMPKEPKQAEVMIPDKDEEQLKEIQITEVYKKERIKQQKEDQDKTTTSDKVTKQEEAQEELDKRDQEVLHIEQEIPEKIEHVDIMMPNEDYENLKEVRVIKEDKKDRSEQQKEDKTKTFTTTDKVTEKAEAQEKIEKQDQQVLHIEQEMPEKIEKVDVMMLDDSYKEQKEVQILKEVKKEPNEQQTESEARMSITTQDQEFEVIKEDKAKEEKEKQDQQILHTKKEMPKEPKQAAVMIPAEDEEQSKEIQITEVCKKEHSVQQKEDQHKTSTINNKVTKQEEAQEEIEKRHQEVLHIEQAMSEKIEHVDIMMLGEDYEKLKEISVTKEEKKDHSEQQKESEPRMPITTRDPEFTVIKEEKPKQEKEKQDQQILGTEKDMHKEPKQSEVMIPAKDEEKLREIQITEVYKKERSEHQKEDHDKTSTTTDKVTKQGEAQDEIEIRAQQDLHAEQKIPEKIEKVDVMMPDEDYEKLKEVPVIQEDKKDHSEQQKEDKIKTSSITDKVTKQVKAQEKIEKQDQQVLHIEQEIPEKIEQVDVMTPGEDYEKLKEISVIKEDGKDHSEQQTESEARMSIITQDQEFEVIKEDKAKQVKEKQDQQILHTKKEMPKEPKQAEVMIPAEDEEQLKEIQITEVCKKEHSDQQKGNQDKTSGEGQEETEIRDQQDLHSEQKMPEKIEQVDVIMPDENYEKLKEISVIKEEKKDHSEQQKESEAKLSITTQDQEYVVIKEEQTKQVKEKQDQQILDTEKDMHKEPKQVEVMIPGEDEEELKEIQITEVYKKECSEQQKDHDKTSTTTDKVTKQGEAQEEIEIRDEQILHIEQKLPEKIQQVDVMMPNETFEKLEEVPIIKEVKKDHSEQQTESEARMSITTQDQEFEVIKEDKTKQEKEKQDQQLLHTKKEKPKEPKQSEVMIPAKDEEKLKEIQIMEVCKKEHSDQQKEDQDKTSGKGREEIEIQPQQDLHPEQKMHEKIEQVDVMMPDEDYEKLKDISVIKVEKKYHSEQQKESEAKLSITTQDQEFVAIKEEKLKQEKEKQDQQILDTEKDMPKEPKQAEVLIPAEDEEKLKKIQITETYKKEHSDQQKVDKAEISTASDKVTKQLVSQEEIEIRDQQDLHTEQKIPEKIEKVDEMMPDEDYEKLKEIGVIKGDKKDRSEQQKEDKTKTSTSTDKVTKQAEAQGEIEKRDQEVLHIEQEMPEKIEQVDVITPGEDYEKLKEISVIKEDEKDHSEQQTESEARMSITTQHQEFQVIKEDKTKQEKEKQDQQILHTKKEKPKEPKQSEVMIPAKDEEKLKEIQITEVCKKEHSDQQKEDQDKTSGKGREEIEIQPQQDLHLEQKMHEKIEQVDVMMPDEDYEKLKDISVIKEEKKYHSEQQKESEAKLSITTQDQEFVAIKEEKLKQEKEKQDQQILDTEKDMPKEPKQAEVLIPAEDEEKLKKIQIMETYKKKHSDQQKVDKAKISTTSDKVTKQLVSQEEIEIRDQQDLHTEQKIPEKIEKVDEMMPDGDYEKLKEIGVIKEDKKDRSEQQKEDKTKTSTSTDKVTKQAEAQGEMEKRDQEVLHIKQEMPEKIEQVDVTTPGEDYEKLKEISVIKEEEKDHREQQRESETGMSVTTQDHEFVVIKKEKENQGLEKQGQQILHTEKEMFKEPKQAEVSIPAEDEKKLKEIQITEVYITDHREDDKAKTSTSSDKVTKQEEPKEEIEIPDQQDLHTEQKMPEKIEKVHVMMLDEDYEKLKEVPVIKEDDSEQQKEDKTKTSTTTDKVTEHAEVQEEIEKRDQEVLHFEQEIAEKTGQVDVMMLDDSYKEKKEVQIIKEAKKGPSEPQIESEARISITTQDQEFSVIKKEKPKQEKEKQDQQILDTEKDMHKEPKQSEVMIPAEDEKKLKEIQITEVYKKEHSDQQNDDKAKTSTTTDKITKQRQAQEEMEHRDQLVSHIEKKIPEKIEQFDVMMPDEDYGKLKEVPAIKEDIKELSEQQQKSEARISITTQGHEFIAPKEEIAQHEREKQDQVLHNEKEMPKESKQAKQMEEQEKMEERGQQVLHIERKMPEKIEQVDVMIFNEDYEKLKEAPINEDREEPSEQQKEFLARISITTQDQEFIKEEEAQQEKENQDLHILHTEKEMPKESKRAEIILPDEEETQITDVYKKESSDQQKEYESKMSITIYNHDIKVSIQEKSQQDKEKGGQQIFHTEKEMPEKSEQAEEMMRGEHYEILKAVSVTKTKIREPSDQQKEYEAKLPTTTEDQETIILKESKLQEEKEKQNQQILNDEKKMTKVSEKVEVKINDKDYEILKDVPTTKKEEKDPSDQQKEYETEVSTTTVDQEIIILEKPKSQEEKGKQDQQILHVENKMEKKSKKVEVMLPDEEYEKLKDVPSTKEDKKEPSGQKEQYEGKMYTTTHDQEIKIAKQEKAQEEMEKRDQQVLNIEKEIPEKFEQVELIPDEDYEELKKVTVIKEYKKEPSKQQKLYEEAGVSTITQGQEIITFKGEEAQHENEKEDQQILHTEISMSKEPKKDEVMLADEDEEKLKEIKITELYQREISDQQEEYEPKVFTTIYDHDIKATKQDKAQQEMNEKSEQKEPNGQQKEYGGEVFTTTQDQQIILLMEEKTSDKKETQDKQILSIEKEMLEKSEQAEKLMPDEDKKELNEVPIKQEEEKESSNQQKEYETKVPTNNLDKEIMIIKERTSHEEKEKRDQQVLQIVKEVPKKSEKVEVIICDEKYEKLKGAPTTIDDIKGLNDQQEQYEYKTSSTTSDQKINVIKQKKTQQETKKRDSELSHIEKGMPEASEKFETMLPHEDYRKLKEVSITKTEKREPSDQEKEYEAKVSTITQDQEILPLMEEKAQDKKEKQNKQILYTEKEMPEKLGEAKEVMPDEDKEKFNEVPITQEEDREPSDQQKEYETKVSTTILDQEMMIIKERKSHEEKEKQEQQILHIQKDVPKKSEHVVVTICDDDHEKLKASPTIKEDKKGPSDQQEQYEVEVSTAVMDGEIIVLKEEITEQGKEKQDEKIYIEKEIAEKLEEIHVMLPNEDQGNFKVTSITETAKKEHYDQPKEYEFKISTTTTDEEIIICEDKKTEQEKVKYQKIMHNVKGMPEKSDQVKLMLHGETQRKWEELPITKADKKEPSDRQTDYEAKVSTTIKDEEIAETKEKKTEQGKENENLHTGKEMPENSEQVQLMLSHEDQGKLKEIPIEKIDTEKFSYQQKEYEAKASTTIMEGEIIAIKEKTAEQEKDKEDKKILHIGKEMEKISEHFEITLADEHKGKLEEVIITKSYKEEPSDQQNEYESKMTTTTKDGETKLTKEEKDEQEKEEGKILHIGKGLSEKSEQAQLMLTDKDERKLEEVRITKIEKREPSDQQKEHEVKVCTSRKDEEIIVTKENQEQENGKEKQKVLLIGAVDKSEHFDVSLANEDEKKLKDITITEVHKKQPGGLQKNYEAKVLITAKDEEIMITKEKDSKQETKKQEQKMSIEKETLNEFGTDKIMQLHDDQGKVKEVSITETFKKESSDQLRKHETEPTIISKDEISVLTKDKKVKQSSEKEDEKELAVEEVEFKKSETDEILPSDKYKEKLKETILTQADIKEPNDEQKKHEIEVSKNEKQTQKELAFEKEKPKKSETGEDIEQVLIAETDKKEPTKEEDEKEREEHKIITVEIQQLETSEKDERIQPDSDQGNLEKVITTETDKLYFSEQHTLKEKDETEVIAENVKIKSSEDKEKEHEKAKKEQNISVEKQSLGKPENDEKIHSDKDKETLKEPSTQETQVKEPSKTELLAEIVEHEKENEVDRIDIIKEMETEHGNGEGEDKILAVEKQPLVKSSEKHQQIKADGTLLTLQDISIIDGDKKEFCNQHILKGKYDIKLPTTKNSEKIELNKEEKDKQLGKIPKDEEIHLDTKQENLKLELEVTEMEADIKESSAQHVSKQREEKKSSATKNEITEFIEKPSEMPHLEHFESVLKSTTSEPSKTSVVIKKEIGTKSTKDGKEEIITKYTEQTDDDLIQTKQISLDVIQSIADETQKRVFTSDIQSKEKIPELKKGQEGGSLPDIIKDATVTTKPVDTGKIKEDKATNKQKIITHETDIFSTIIDDDSKKESQKSIKKIKEETKNDSIMKLEDKLKEDISDDIPKETSRIEEPCLVKQAVIKDMKQPLEGNKQIINNQKSIKMEKHTEPITETLTIINESDEISKYEFEDKSEVETESFKKEKKIHEITKPDLVKDTEKPMTDEYKKGETGIIESPIPVASFVRKYQISEPFVEDGQTQVIINEDIIEKTMNQIHAEAVTSFPECKTEIIDEFKQLNTNIKELDANDEKTVLKEIYDLQKAYPVLEQNTKHLETDSLATVHKEIEELTNTEVPIMQSVVLQNHLDKVFEIKDDINKEGCVNEIKTEKTESIKEQHDQLMEKLDPIKKQAKSSIEEVEQMVELVKIVEATMTEKYDDAKKYDDKYNREKCLSIEKVENVIISKPEVETSSIITDNGKITTSVMIQQGIPEHELVIDKKYITSNDTRSKEVERETDDQDVFSISKITSDTEKIIKRLAIMDTSNDAPVVRPDEKTVQTITKDSILDEIQHGKDDFFNKLGADHAEIRADRITHELVTTAYERIQQSTPNSDVAQEDLVKRSKEIVKEIPKQLEGKPSTIREYGIEDTLAKLATHVIITPVTTGVITELRLKEIEAQIIEPVIKMDASKDVIQISKPEEKQQLEFEIRHQTNTGSEIMKVKPVVKEQNDSVHVQNIFPAQEIMNKRFPLADGNDDLSEVSTIQDDINEESFESISNQDYIVYKDKKENIIGKKEPDTIKYINEFCKPKMTDVEQNSQSDNISEPISIDGTLQVHEEKQRAETLMKDSVSTDDETINHHDQRSPSMTSNEKDEVLTFIKSKNINVDAEKSLGFPIKSVEMSTLLIEKGHTDENKLYEIHDELTTLEGSGVNENVTHVEKKCTFDHNKEKLQSEDSTKTCIEGTPISDYEGIQPKSRSTHQTVTYIERKYTSDDDKEENLKGDNDNSHIKKRYLHDDDDDKEIQRHSEGQIETEIERRHFDDKESQPEGRTIRSELMKIPNGTVPTGAKMVTTNTITVVHKEIPYDGILSPELQLDATQMRVKFMTEFALEKKKQPVLKSRSEDGFKSDIKLTQMILDEKECVNESDKTSSLPSLDNSKFKDAYSTDKVEEQHSISLPLLEGSHHPQNADRVSIDEPKLSPHKREKVEIGQTKSISLPVIQDSDNFMTLPHLYKSGNIEDLSVNRSTEIVSDLSILPEKTTTSTEFIEKEIIPHHETDIFMSDGNKNSDIAGKSENGSTDTEIETYYDAYGDNNTVIDKQPSSIIAGIREEALDILRSETPSSEDHDSDDYGRPLTPHSDVSTEQTSKMTILHEDKHDYDDSAQEVSDAEFEPAETIFLPSTLSLTQRTTVYDTGTVTTTTTSTTNIEETIPAQFSGSFLKEKESESSSQQEKNYRQDNIATTTKINKDNEKDDPIKEWGKPLGLPLPKTRNEGLGHGNGFLIWSPTEHWGIPLGLPSPAPTHEKNANGDVEINLTPLTPKETPKKTSEKKSSNVDNTKNNGTIGIVRDQSRSKESPAKLTGKGSKWAPVYVDLAYVPHQGNSLYTNIEFFKKVRARHYVFSGTDPSKDVFNALMEAKKTWEDRNLEVTVIPTYDTDALGCWITENEDALIKLKIDLSPSASRCTINLQDHDTSCSAFRLEF